MTVSKFHRGDGIAQSAVSDGLVYIVGQFGTGEIAAVQTESVRQMICEFSAITNMSVTS